MNKEKKSAIFFKLSSFIPGVAMRKAGNCMNNQDLLFTNQNRLYYGSPILFPREKIHL